MSPWAFSLSIIFLNLWHQKANTAVDDDNDDDDVYLFICLLCLLGHFHFLLSS